VIEAICNSMHLIADHSKDQLAARKEYSNCIAVAGTNSPGHFAVWRIASHVLIVGRSSAGLQKDATSFRPQKPRTYFLVPVPGLVG
jgi:hypothetical protein